MKDRIKKDQKKKTIRERPIDPSSNYEDMIGDSSGMTGITTGSVEQTSADPNDTSRDVDAGNLPGGIIEGKKTNPTGIPRTALSEKEYIKSARKTMSATATQVADDVASDADNPTTAQDTDEIDEIKEELRENNQSSEEDQPVDKDPPSPLNNSQTSPAISGEQSVSGDMPDDESDDDTLENAHDVGEQEEEDLEHPEELDISRDIDKAEEYIRTH